MSPLKTKIRKSFSTLSSDVVLKDEHLETYYRGNLLKINYSEVRDNPACQEVYYFLDNMFQEDVSAKPGPEAIPELVMRKNDMLNFDWDDGTMSSVNLTKLIETNLMDENEDFHEDLIGSLEEVEDAKLEKTLGELDETGFSRTDSGLKSTGRLT